MKKLNYYLIISILIFSFCFTFSPASFASNSGVDNLAQESQSNQEILETKLYSDSILLIESSTGDILYEKNANDKMYPASTTKMLTAIIVLEKCYLNELVTVSDSAISAVPPTYTKASLQVGEQFRVEELLYAMLLPSGNDAANVLAEHVAGSIPAFADVMNEKAKALGLTASHFTNPSGIHDENLYTTAHDLSLVARYAMQNEKFREIVRAKSYTLPATPIHPAEDRIFYTTNLLLEPSQTNYYYEYATGIKTGFTTPAGDCLVASAKKDGIEFLAICLHSSSLDNGLREKFLDCKTLFDFAFDHYITYYQDLQANLDSAESLQEQNTSLTSKDTYQDVDFSRTLLKIFAAFIILCAFKMLFFGKKKNRRKKLKTRRK